MFISSRLLSTWYLWVLLTVLVDPGLVQDEEVAGPSHGRRKRRRHTIGCSVCNFRELDEVGVCICNGFSM